MNIAWIMGDELRGKNGLAWELEAKQLPFSHITSSVKEDSVLITAVVAGSR